MDSGYDRSTRVAEYGSETRYMTMKLGISRMYILTDKTTRFTNYTKR